MTRDRSLDEFLGRERRGPDDETADTEPATEPEAETESEAVDDDPQAEPAVSTYDFSPDGAECSACGAVVEKRWRDDGELVCPDCKQW